MWLIRATWKAGDCSARSPCPPGAHKPRRGGQALDKGGQLKPPECDVSYEGKRESGALRKTKGTAEVTSGRWVCSQAHVLCVSPEREAGGRREGRCTEGIACAKGQWWVELAVWGGLTSLEDQKKWYKMRWQGCLGHGKISNFTLSAVNSLGRILGWVAEMK